MVVEVVSISSVAVADYETRVRCNETDDINVKTVIVFVYVTLSDQLKLLNNNLL